MSKVVKPENLSIVSIKTLKGYIDSSSEVVDDKNIYEYNFIFETKTAVDRKTKLVRFLLDVTISKVNAENKPVLDVASYTNEFVFRVEDMDDFVTFKEESKSANLDMTLGVVLANIAYGTMRGILYLRTQGTILDGIIMPIIDPKKLLTVNELPAANMPGQTI